MNAWATLGGTGTSMAVEPLAAKTEPLLQFVVMSTEHIVALLTAERDRLNKAITLLGGTSTTPAKRRGRTPGKKASTPEAAPAEPSAPTKRRRRRKMSAEGRASIAAAQKKRWAATKKK